MFVIICSRAREEKEVFFLNSATSQARNSSMCVRQKKDLLIGKRDIRGAGKVAAKKKKCKDFWKLISDQEMRQSLPSSDIYVLNEINAKDA